MHKVVEHIPYVLFGVPIIQFPGFSVPREYSQTTDDEIIASFREHVPMDKEVLPWKRIALPYFASKHYTVSQKRYLTVDLSIHYNPLRPCLKVLSVHRCATSLP